MVVVVVVGVELVSLLLLLAAGRLSLLLLSSLPPPCSPPVSAGGEVVAVPFPGSAAKVETGMNAYAASAIPTINIESVSVMLLFFFVLLDIDVRTDPLL